MLMYCDIDFVYFLCNLNWTIKYFFQKGYISLTCVITDHLHRKCSVVISVLRNNTTLQLSLSLITSNYHSSKFWRLEFSSLYNKYWKVSISVYNLALFKVSSFRPFFFFWSYPLAKHCDHIKLLALHVNIFFYYFIRSYLR